MPEPLAQRAAWSSDGTAATAPFVFIVGSGRSGTTLLRAMFDAHPDMAVAHEAHVVAAMGRHRRRYERRGGFCLERFAADLFADPKFRRLGLDEAAVRAALGRHAPATFADAMRAVFASYADGHGKPRFADKTPGYVLRIRLLARIFPEARFIHVIRDGRDVALAFSDVRFGPHSIGETAIYWKRRVRRGRRSGQVLGPQRYREVRYEALVADAEKVLVELCTFVELAFHPAMLRYFEHPEQSVEATGDPGAHQRLLLPPTPGLRNWADEMSATDLRVFEVVAGPVLDELGYGRALPLPSPRDRVEARWRWARWQAYRVRFNLRRASSSFR